MSRRVLIWLLSAALATAPLAPAWAMARATAESPRGSLSSAGEAHPQSAHARHAATQQLGAPHADTPVAGNTDRGAPMHGHHAVHGAHPLDHLAHPGSAHIAPAADTDASPAAHAHAPGQPAAAGHSSSDCGDGRCDGQCCAVCILTLATGVPHLVTVAFGAGESPAYRAHTYTSFVPPLPGRPPQS